MSSNLSRLFLVDSTQSIPAGGPNYFTANSFIQALAGFKRLRITGASGYVLDPNDTGFLTMTAADLSVFFADNSGNVVFALALASLPTPTLNTDNGPTLVMGGSYRDVDATSVFTQATSMQLAIECDLTNSDAAAHNAQLVLTCFAELIP